jgi:hypothetical protein
MRLSPAWLLHVSCLTFPLLQIVFDLVGSTVAVMLNLLLPVCMLRYRPDTIDPSHHNLGARALCPKHALTACSVSACFLCSALQSCCTF